MSNTNRSYQNQFNCYLEECIKKYSSEQQTNLIDKFIVKTEDTCSGEYRINGTRIRVSDILWIVNDGLDSINEFLEDYDYITVEMMDACVLFYNRIDTTH